MSSKADDMSKMIDASIDALLDCKGLLGPSPSNDSADWAKDEILSRLHDVDVCSDKIRRSYGKWRAGYIVFHYDKNLKKFVDDGIFTNFELANEYIESHGGPEIMKLRPVELNWME